MSKANKNRKQVLVPRLRFPEFRGAGEWETRTLAEIAEFYKGKGISKADITIDGSQSCIRYGELYTIYGELIEEVVSKTDLLPKDLFMSNAGDVIIPSSGETKIDIATAACVAYDNIALGGDLNVIRSKQNGVFLSYYLNGALRYEISKVAQGDTVAHLYKSNLEKLAVAIPQPEEQQKIADCLSSLDALIAAQAEKIDALKTHKKGLMQQLFPREGETVPRLRFPEFRDTGEWETTCVSDILKVRDERRPPDDDVPLFSLTIESGVTAKSERYNREFLVTDPGKKKYKTVRPKDIVYNPSNLRWGAINYSRLDHSVVVSPIYEVLYVANKNVTAFEFIAYALMRPEQIAAFVEKGQGTLVERIAVKIEFFLETTLSIPPSFEEQQIIAYSLSSLDALIVSQTEWLDALKTHKKGLMQQLFPSPEAVGA